MTHGYSVFNHIHVPHCVLLLLLLLKLAAPSERAAQLDSCFGHAAHAVIQRVLGGSASRSARTAGSQAAGLTAVNGMGRSPQQQSPGALRAASPGSTGLPIRTTLSRPREKKADGSVWGYVPRPGSPSASPAVLKWVQSLDLVRRPRGSSTHERAGHVLAAVYVGRVRLHICRQCLWKGGPCRGDDLLDTGMRSQSQSITNPRRDLQNGYVVAEMLARLYPVRRAVDFAYAWSAVPLMWRAAAGMLPGHMGGGTLHSQLCTESAKRVSMHVSAPDAGRSAHDNV